MGTAVPVNMTESPDDNTGQSDVDGVLTADGVDVDLYELVVEAYLSHPTIVLCPTLSTVSDVTVRPQSSTKYHNREMLFFTAVGRDFTTFEQTLVTDSTVSDPALVGVDPDYRVYRVALQQSTQWPTAAPEALGASILTAESLSGGWLVRMRLPDRAVLSALSSHCREHDIDFRVRQLYSTDTDEGRSRGTRYGVTDDQERLLRAAHESGYYDVPRQCSQNELAEEFGVSPSAVSQQLRRGTGALIASTLVTPTFEGEF
jgi:predicted DNA binding protein